METLLVDDWFQRQLRAAGSQLLGEETVKDVSLERLYQMMDPAFLERSKLIVDAYNLFAIPHESLESQSNENLRSLLGLDQKAQKAVREENMQELLPLWKSIPMDVQMMMYTSKFSLADVERLCMAIGLQYCIDNRIFSRIFATKHPQGYKEYLQRHPDHLRPSWMLRAYEVGLFASTYGNHNILFEFKNPLVSGSHDIVIKDKYIYYGTKTGRSYSASSKVMQDLFDILEYGHIIKDLTDKERTYTNLEYYASIYRYVVEAVTYVLLKDNYVITEISGEIVTQESWGPKITPAPVPDVKQRIISTGNEICYHKKAGKCSHCDSKFCGSCFENHLPCV